MDQPADTMNPIHLPKISWYEGVKAREWFGVVKVEIDGVTFTIIEDYVGCESSAAHPGEDFARIDLSAKTRNGRIDELVAMARHRRRMLKDFESISVDEDLSWLRQVPPMQLARIKSQLRKFDSNRRAWMDEIQPAAPSPQMELPTNDQATPSPETLAR
jgi:hypothetical protein